MCSRVRFCLFFLSQCMMCASSNDAKTRIQFTDSEVERMTHMQKERVFDVFICVPYFLHYRTMSRLRVLALLVFHRFKARKSVRVNAHIFFGSAISIRIWSLPYHFYYLVLFLNLLVTSAVTQDKVSGDNENAVVFVVRLS